MNATLTPPTPAAPPQPSSPENKDALVRERAIKQIQRRRYFYRDVVISTIILVFVAVIWATGEYQNAGGWPTNGFSQSSGIPDTWNIWIIYPFMAWVLYVAGRSWAYFVGTSISESDIQREIEHQEGSRGA